MKKRSLIKIAFLTYILAEEIKKAVVEIKINYAAHEIIESINNSHDIITTQALDGLSNGFFDKLSGN